MVGAMRLRWIAVLPITLLMSLPAAGSAQAPLAPFADASKVAPAYAPVWGAGTPPPDVTEAPAKPARPDIIVVYIDDVPPIDGRFWAMGRTPNIRKYIIDDGLTFRNAVDEAPLCCPARANLLTGLHTHNNHVTINDASQFDPSETIATELQDVGYRTAWIGKYLNRYISIHGAAHHAYEAGWDVFEPMSGGSYGYFYWHKGDRNHTRPAGHSMQLVQQLSVATLRSAPRTSRCSPCSRRMPGITRTSPCLPTSAPASAPPSGPGSRRVTARRLPSTSRRGSGRWPGGPHGARRRAGTHWSRSARTCWGSTSWWPR